MRKSSVSFNISYVKWGEKMSMFNLLVSGCPLLFRLYKNPWFQINDYLNIWITKQTELIAQLVRASKPGLCLVERPGFESRSDHNLFHIVMYQFATLFFIHVCAQGDGQVIGKTRLATFRKNSVFRFIFMSTVYIYLCFVLLFF